MPCVDEILVGHHEGCERISPGKAVPTLLAIVDSHSTGSHRIHPGGVSPVIALGTLIGLAVARLHTWLYVVDMSGHLGSICQAAN